MFNNFVEVETYADLLYSYAHPGSIPANVRFTGWKYGGYPIDDAHSFDGSAGFVCQWVWRNPNDREKQYFVNLPGMQSGTFQEGGLLTIGEERIREGADPEAIRLLVQQGKEKLIALVKESEGVDISF